MDRVPELSPVELGPGGWSSMAPRAIKISEKGRLVIGRDLWKEIGSPKRVVFLEGNGVLAIRAGDGSDSRGLDKGRNPGLLSKLLSKRLLELTQSYGCFPAEIHEHESKPTIFAFLEQQAWATYSDAATKDGDAIPDFPEEAV